MTLTRNLTLSALLVLAPLAPAQSASPLETNRAVVRAFIEAVYWRDDPDAAERLLSDDYLEHSPTASDAEPTPSPASAPPELKLTFERLIAEGEFVTSLVRVDAKGVAPYYLIDVFRLERGLIVEHWDSSEPSSGAPASGPVTPGSFKGKPSNFRKPGQKPKP